MKLSCEIASETLSMCIHGMPVKFPCEKCCLEHRISLMESQIKTLTEMYKTLSVKVASSEDHRCNEIDENRKISKRVDEVEHKQMLLLKELGSNNDKKYKLIPYKCPLCEGKGKIIFTFPNGNYCEANCKSCDGKGILWG